MAALAFISILLAAAGCGGDAGGGGSLDGLVSDAGGGTGLSDCQIVSPGSGTDGGAQPPSQPAGGASEPESPPFTPGVPSPPSTNVWDGPVTPTMSQLLTLLTQLPPLPKVNHYTEHLSNVQQPDLLPFTREIVRITRSSSVGGGYNQSETRKAVELAIEANTAEPNATPATLCLMWSPWLIEWRNDHHEATDFGQPYLDGLQRMTTFLENQRSYIAAANAELGSNISVSVFMLELEVWHVRENDEIWNDALVQKQDAAYNLVKSYFPDSLVLWYGRGGMFEAYAAEGLVFWAEPSTFTHRELGDGCSTSLYRVGAGLVNTLETFRQTINNVDQYYGTDVPIVPFIALAAGYRQTLEQPDVFTWDNTWDYDLINSYQLGRFANQPQYATHDWLLVNGADWSRAPFNVFYPPPLDYYRTAEELAVGLKHFVAYAYGAAGLPLPALP